MDLEQVRKDFAEGKMISKCTWALVLQSTVEMEEALQTVASGNRQDAVLASDCLGRVAAL